MTKQFKMEDDQKNQNGRQQTKIKMEDDKQKLKMEDDKKIENGRR